MHQKQWSEEEASVLQDWVHSGGCILMFSDSAAGGHHRQVGLRNQVEQHAVNSLLARFGMQVAVDHGGGTRSYRSREPETSPITEGGLVLEGEGFYDFHMGRGINAAAPVLAGYRGLLQCDGYGVYRSLAAREGFLLVGCMAHARRKFLEAFEDNSGSRTGCSSATRWPDDGPRSFTPCY